MTPTDATRTCQKCGHVGVPLEAGSAAACPACGAIYAKVEAALRARPVVREVAAVPAAAAQPLDLEQNAAEGNRRLVAHLVYLLYVLPIGLTGVVGVVTAHVMLAHDRGTWLGSHFRWQINTFWISLLAAIAIVMLAVAVFGVAALFGGSSPGARMVAGGVGAAAAVIVPGGLLLLWTIYRIVKGWYRLIQQEAL